jgi:type III restriction enzyme
LGNVLKLIRPIVIMDEGHKAASDLALETLNGFNPSFILELSATPKNNSNILISVRGEELKKEQMIKLPINVFSYGESDWKQTLNHSHKKLQELSKLSTNLQKDEGQYIRPIMLVKVDPKKKNDPYDHAEDVKKYLIDNLGVRQEEIRMKLSEKDEIKDEDLFHKLCPVKYIITKDALKEGWDCSFAYVLVYLSIYLPNYTRFCTEPKTP